MNVQVHPTADHANGAAADCLAAWLTEPATRQVMVAAGNTPIALYGLIAARRLPLTRLNVHVLDEYVGVPADEPRTRASWPAPVSTRIQCVPGDAAAAAGTDNVAAMTAASRDERSVRAMRYSPGRSGKSAGAAAPWG